MHGEERRHRPRRRGRQRLEHEPDQDGVRGVQDDVRRVISGGREPMELVLDPQRREGQRIVLRDRAGSTQIRRRPSPVRSAALAVT